MPPWEKYGGAATDSGGSAPWDRYKAAGATQAGGGPGAAPDTAAPQGDDATKAVTGRTQVPRPRGDDSNRGFVSGNLNIGIAGLLGLPADTGANVMNLGAAGAHAVRDNFRTSAQGPRVFNDPGAFNPPFQNPVGGSQWWENLGRRAGLITDAAQPQSVGGRYAAAVLQMAPSAMLARPSLQQLPRALAATTTSALAGQAGADTGGPEWAGPASMLPGGRKLLTPGEPLSTAPTISERATTERQARDFGKAKELGIPVPPRAMKADKPQQKIQDSINQDLRRPAGTEVNAETLNQYRSMHANDYAAVAKALPEVKATPTFQKAIKSLATEERKLRAEFPNSVKDVGLQQVFADFTKPTYTTEGAMAQVRRLRESAKNNLAGASATDDTKMMGLAQLKLANAMEDLIGENLKETGNAEMYGKWLAARTKIAKSYNVESALDPRTGKVDPGRLAALETDQPLSGALKKIAEVSRAFPEAAKHGKEDDALFTKRVSPMAITHPSAAIAHWGTRWHDPITMSSPYQHMRVDPASHLTPEQHQLLRYLAASQSANRGDIPTPP